MPLALTHRWFAIARWTLFAMIDTEELGVTHSNLDEMLKSLVPGIRRLLGQDGTLGPARGLDRRWADNTIKQVGNYGEVFERNIGAGSPLKLPRSANDLYPGRERSATPPDTRAAFALNARRRQPGVQHLDRSSR